MKNSFLLLLTVIFISNSVKSEQYRSYAGAMFDEDLDEFNIEAGGAGPSLRHSGKVRSMLHTLVCGNDPNCPFQSKHFFQGV